MNDRWVSSSSFLDATRKRLWEIDVDRTHDTTVVDGLNRVGESIPTFTQPLLLSGL